MRVRLVVIAFTALLVVPMRASATTLMINFDSLLDSESVTAQFSDLTFSHATVLTAGISLNEFEYPPHSGSNVVFDDGGPMSIEFASPVLSVGGYFTYSSALSFEAFDMGHTSLGLVTSAFASNVALSGDAGSSPNELLILSSAVGISSVTITGSPFGGTFVLDDLTYEASATEVPEPTSVLLVVSGVGLLARNRARAATKCRT